ncbi:MAG: hypothetical protein EG825_05500 [Rhodocyclaceae bacterium]|nr:hypothetical protein [Rhodocyclaceae bacterium]
MKCPVCTATDLVMSERSGIEIDYCPQCRGVWLDRGELDKIIERSMSAGGSAQTHRGTPVHQQDPNHWGRSEHHNDHQGHYEHGQSYHGKKPFWKELFD